MALGLLRILMICALAFALPWPVISAQKEGAEQTPTVSVVEDDEAFNALHKQLLEDDRLQLERPVKTEDAEPARKRSSFSFKLPDWLTSFFSGLGPLMQLLFYVGLGVILCAILYFVYGTLRQVDLQSLRDRKLKHEEADDVIAPSLRPDAGAAKTLLEEADALAARGRFAEAVHLLLFRSIEDIQLRRKERLSTALTAREIGALKDLPEKPRTALGPIIRLVERSFFGGRNVDAEGWQIARKAYEDFAFGEAWT